MAVLAPVTMNDRQYRLAMAQQAEAARTRQAQYDTLPPAVREQLADAPIKPDTEMVYLMYRDATDMMGAKQAEEWVLQTVDTWIRQNVGLVRLLKSPRKRRAVSRRSSPPAHKLAPAVRTVVS